VIVQAPQLDINTVAAGGARGSEFEAGVFKVGPESVGAHPGPACYRKGGQLAVTDANLALGRIIPRYFPHIFGPNEDLPLDTEASRAGLQELMREIAQNQMPQDPHTLPDSEGGTRQSAGARAAGSGKSVQEQERGGKFPSKGEGQMSVEEVALGFLEVANEAMCRPIRELTEMRGYETSRHTLACFGGAGQPLTLPSDL